MSTTFVKTPSITFSIDSPICAKKFYQSNVPLNGYRLSVNKGKAALAKTALAKTALAKTAGKDGSGKDGSGKTRIAS